MSRYFLHINYKPHGVIHELGDCAEVNHWWIQADTIADKCGKKANFLSSAILNSQ
jgi:hypothetical protein